MEPVSTSIAISFATVIGQKVLEDLTKDVVKGAGRKFKNAILDTPKEKALQKCIKSALAAFLATATVKTEDEHIHLESIFGEFVKKEDVATELSALLEGEAPDREKLLKHFKKAGYNLKQLPGINFDRAMDAFEATFTATAIIEDSLRDILDTNLNVIRTGLSKQQLGELQRISRYLEEMHELNLKILNGKLQAVGEKNTPSLQLDLSNLEQLISRLVPPPASGPDPEARRRYLESLAKECLNLPLSALGEDTNDDDGITLDALYVDLDTTSTYMVDEKGKRISERATVNRLKEQEFKTKTQTVREAAVENERLMLLGDPGAGKSAFVKKLSALVAQDLLGVNVHLEDCFKGLLPIFIQLRDLVPRLQTVNISKVSADERTEHLLRIVNEQLSKNLHRLNANAFREGIFNALHQGNCLLVLDGLDEVPFKQRKRIQLTVNALISKYAPKCMIVTCRIRSYTGHNQLSEFQIHTIADMDNEKIKRFITAWYNAKKALGKIDAETAKIRIADLLKGVIKLRALAKNPMMLTTMAIIHYNQHQLPDDRVKLYKLVVDILLRRWRKENLGEEGLRISANLAKVLAGDKKLHELAARLGYEAQSVRKDTQETADINRDQAILLLKKEGYLDSFDLAEEFLDYVDQHSGLLIGRGGESDTTDDDQKGVKPVSYGFYHRSFQEYLAGCHIVSQWNIYTELVDHSQEGDYWAPTVQFGIEELYHNESRRGVLTLKELASHLCPTGSPATEAIERQILWASNIAVLLTPKGIEEDDKFPNGGTAYLDRLRHALVQLLSGKLPFEERAEAAHNLVKLGSTEELNAMRIKPIYFLRKEPMILKFELIESRLRELDFVISTDSPKESKGCLHVYQLQKEDRVVMDYATGLMWQQSGSSTMMDFKNSERYVNKLNEERHVGFNDWRLPTVEEAMSLLERDLKNGNLFIDSVFDAEQRRIWTADSGEEERWRVFFLRQRHRFWEHVASDACYIRAVRSSEYSKQN